MVIKRFIMIILAGISVLGLSGCNGLGQAGAAVFETENVLSVQEDGSIIAVMVESFDESYYQIGELEQMIRTEAENYNAEKGSELIWVEKVETQEGLVNVRLKFADQVTYAEYTASFFFNGTIDEAVTAGIDLNRPLHDLNDQGTTIGRAELAEMGTALIVVADGAAGIMPVLVETFGAVDYVSAGVESGRDERSVRCDVRADERFYIIFSQ